MYLNELYRYKNINEYGWTEVQAFLPSICVQIISEK